MYMHKTAAGAQRKALKKEAQDLARRAKTMRKAAKIMPVAEEKALTLQAEADKAQSQAQALKLDARLEDLQIWVQEKVKETKAGAKTYTYYMASWRERKKVKNVYLGSSQKLSREQALQKARKLKREALGLSSI
jgi:hypothetical protein